MKFIMFTSGAIAVLSILAVAHPTAHDAHQFNELNLPLPHNNVANAVFAGQELSKHIARAHGDDYTEEMWIELAKKLCFDTPSVKECGQHEEVPNNDFIDHWRRKVPLQWHFATFSRFYSYLFARDSKWVVTPSCTTVNSHLFGPFGTLNGTGDETYWFAYLYAGPTSNINNWAHFEGAPISHQRIFTSIIN